MSELLPVRLSWDQFAKEVIPSVLEGIGRAQPSLEVRADAQLVDVWVTPEPDVDWGAAFTRLGWLARMAETLALFEAFSAAVSVEEVRGCLRKQLALHHQLRQKPEGSLGPKAEPGAFPRLWLLSAGDARTATESFGLSEQSPWPPGFRFAAPAFGLCVVVLSALPKTRETLPLRLLGRGPTLAAAVREAMQLPADDPMRRPLVSVLVQHRFAGVDLGLSEREDPMLQEEFQRWQTEIEDRGRMTGQRTVLRRLLERRFGPLDAASAARLEAVQAERLERLADRVLDAGSLAEALAD